MDGKVMQYVKLRTLWDYMSTKPFRIKLVIILDCHIILCPKKSEHVKKPVRKYP
jgi:hypothetical protein